MKKVFSRVIISLGIALFCGGVVIGVKYYYSKQIKTVEVVKEVPVETIIEKEIQISGETIRDSMANIGELCTAEYSYTHVENVDSSREIKGFKIPFTTASFIYSYDGVVMAGIDFTKIQIEKNDIQKIITVVLPDVEIIASDIDQNSFQLYDEKNNIFNPISVSDMADSITDLKNSEEKRAVEKGLFDRARANAILLTENFMHGSYDVEEYKIEVQFDTIE